MVRIAICARWRAVRRHAHLAALGAGAAILAAACSTTGFPLAQAFAQPQGRTQGTAPGGTADLVPDLARAGFAWLALGVDWLDPPPGMGRGPIRQDPAYPYHGNRDGPGQVTPHIGNTRDPVLKPWAARQMQESNDEVLAGRRGLPFSAQSTCYPGGVPEQLLTPAQPFYFIQTPGQVWMIWERLDPGRNHLIIKDRYRRLQTRRQTSFPVRLRSELRCAITLRRSSRLARL